MYLRYSLFLCLLSVMSPSPAFATWESYEETTVKGTIQGTIKQGSIIKMQSGSIYEVTGLTLQIVLEIAPEAVVLKDGTQFKLSITGFSEPLMCKQLVPPNNAAKATQPEQKSTSPVAFALPKDTPLDTLVPPAQQQLMGLQKLTPQEREMLRVYLIALYTQGIEQGKRGQLVPSSSTTASRLRTAKSTPPSSTASPSPSAAKSDASSSPVAPSANAVIESKVDGEFNGWEGETIVKLVNGQIWQQTEYYYHYHYAYRPDVLIYPSAAGYKMKVQGVDRSVGVTQIK